MKRGLSFLIVFWLICATAVFPVDFAQATVADQTPVNSYTGNGAATTFSYTFKIFVNADIKVTIDGTLKTLTNDYTVTGAGQAGGGSVVFVSAPATGTAVVFYRDMPYTRTTDYAESGDLLASTLNDDIDKPVMLIQQQRADIFRSIKLPQGEFTDQVISQDAASRANKVVAFNVEGNVTALAVSDLSSLYTTVGYGLQVTGQDLHQAPAVTASGTDTYTATVPGVMAYVSGAEYRISFTNANTIAAATLNINSLGAKTIKKEGGSVALVAGDIPAGHAAILRYNGTYMILINPVTVTDITNADTVDTYHASLVSTGNTIPVANASGVIAPGWGAIPVGGILPFAGTTAPSGYLLADGTAVSRTTYADLFAVISTSYGVGNGSTTFNLPNLGGKVAVGKSAETEFDVLGEMGGAKTHTLTTAEIPAHTHQAAPNMYLNDTGGSYLTPIRTASGGTADNYNTAANTGGGGAHNNLQPYITLNYVIKY